MSSVGPIIQPSLLISNILANGLHAPQFLQLIPTHLLVETPNTFNVKLPAPELLNNLINTLEQLVAQNQTPELEYKLKCAKNFVEIIEAFKTQGLIKSDIDLAIFIDTVQKPEAIFQAKKSELNSILKLLIL